jgi:hypothetical protein
MWPFWMVINSSAKSYTSNPSCIKLYHFDRIGQPVLKLLPDFFYDLSCR